MGFFRALLVFGVALAATAATAVDPIAAPAEQEQRVAREEIARILAADNVDSTVMTSREVAMAIQSIPRGSAPDDFWNAYQAHVRAWEAAAAAEERDSKLTGEELAANGASHDALVESQLAIAASFAKLQRIAESYGVSMPQPTTSAVD